MPLYEYECQSCGHAFEYLLLNTSPPPKCPACGKKKLTQQVSLPTVSSEARREANLSAAHKKASAQRNEKARSDHADHHHHFD